MAVCCHIVIPCLHRSRFKPTVTTRPGGRPCLPIWANFRLHRTQVNGAVNTWLAGRMGGSLKRIMMLLINVCLFQPNMASAVLSSHAWMLFSPQTSSKQKTSSSLQVDISKHRTHMPTCSLAFVAGMTSGRTGPACLVHLLEVGQNWHG